MEQAGVSEYEYIRQSRARDARHKNPKIIVLDFNAKHSEHTKKEGFYMGPSCTRLTVGDMRTTQSVKRIARRPSQLKSQIKNSTHPRSRGRILDAQKKL